MIDISLAGFIGAVVGMVVAAISYGMVVDVIERGMQARRRSPTPEEREAFELQMSVMRRVVLATDMIVFAGVGYWLGYLIGG